MAIENSDGVNGSLGPIVYYMRKGKKCMRTKPLTFNDAKTPGQLKHREKIRRSAAFLRTCIKAINIGYQDSDKDSPSNEARSYIMKNCFIDAEPMPLLDFPKVMLSRGTIAAPVNASLFQEGASVVISWNPPAKGDRLNPEDKVMVVMYSDDSKEGSMHFLRNVAYRRDGTITLPIPYSAASLQVWIFFARPDGSTNQSRSKISDSVYLGEVEFHKD